MPWTKDIDRTQIILSVWSDLNETVLNIHLWFAEWGKAKDRFPLNDRRIIWGITDNYLDEPG